MGYTIAKYLVQDKSGHFEKKAEQIAVGMTVGSWTELPETKKASMQKHLGHVVSVETIAPAPNGEPRGLIAIAYPDINYSPDIPALLTTVFGKVSMDGKIRLVDLTLSAEFISRFKGAKFGIAGMRERLGVHGRPLLMSIFKSCIGHDLPALVEQFRLQALGGVNLIKDDEIFFENQLAPFDKRLPACLEAAREVEQETGHPVHYAINLTGRTDELKDKAKRAAEKGATVFLLNVLTYGFDVLQSLAEDPEIPVPIMAHPAMAGAFYPPQEYGIAASVILGRLMRLAGADMVLYPSPYGSVALEKEEALKVADMLREDWTYSEAEVGTGAELVTGQGTTNKRTVPDLRPVFPVPSAGIHPGLVPLLVRDFGTDFIVNAGGGIHGHPGGATAGGKAFNQAIDAVMAGQTLDEAAETNHELNLALEKWGNPETAS
jgi:2,3-diketo-5-methylthiopentyl-1-phosphate enolase